METAPPAGRRQHETDEQILHKLGYAQELFRGDGRVPELRDLVHDHLDPRGLPDVVLRRFRARRPRRGDRGAGCSSACFSTIIALAMAEIASAFPTAGGLYYWASKLGQPRLGLVTGWFNLIGQIAVTAAIGYGLATFGTVLFDYWFSYSAHMNDWFGFSANTSIFVLYAIFLMAAGIVNMFQVSDHGDAEHDLGVLAHGGRRVHRARADHRPGQPPELRLRLRRDGQRLRVTATRRTTSRIRRSGSCSGSGCCCRSTRSPASTRRRTWPRRRVRRRGWRPSACTWRSSSRSSSAGSSCWR